jgi:hypothetical protein
MLGLVVLLLFCRVRRRLVFQDKPEYFEYPGGFLRFEPDLPPDLMKPPAPSNYFDLDSTREHFQLVNHQFTQASADGSFSQLARALRLCAPGARSVSWILRPVAEPQAVPPAGPHRFCTRPGLGPGGNHASDVGEDRQILGCP